jgi:hypothetical protein
VCKGCMKRELSYELVKYDCTSLVHKWSTVKSMSGDVKLVPRKKSRSYGHNHRKKQRKFEMSLGEYYIFK